MKKALTLLGLTFLPALALAQNFEGEQLNTYFGGVIGFVNGTVIPLIIALAILVFLWGMFQYFILGSSDDEKKSKGKQLMLWGLTGFVVMFSLLGIISLLVNTFGLAGGTVTPISIPF